MQRPGEMVFNVSAAAQRLWTSTQKLEDVPPQHYVELCSMINRALRDDAPEVMPSLAVMVRGINVMCITRRKPSEQKLPPAMRTFRGGELPMQQVEFYRLGVGKKYRVPGYLATSFSERVAYAFLYNKFAEGKTPVKWIVEMDPRGRDDPVFKCKQVNFLWTATHWGSRSCCLRRTAFSRCWRCTCHFIPATTTQWWCGCKLLWITLERTRGWTWLRGIDLMRC